MKKNTGTNPTACRFPIDFIEFCFLVEACIPPRPIARSMFWTSVIDKHYHAMTPEERERLYEWICKNYTYQEGIKKKDEDCLLFQARFAPENQVVVKTKHSGKEEQHEAFVWGTRFYISSTTSIQEQYIIDVKGNTPRNGGVWQPGLPEARNNSTTPPGAHYEEA